MVSLTLAVIIYSAICAIGLSLFNRIISWIRRIRVFRQSMPVIPTLFPPDSLFRRIWPRKWQTFHQDWNMQYKRTLYHKLGSDNFALVCLFEYDKVYLAEPAAVLDLKTAKAEQFPKDMRIYAR